MLIGGHGLQAEVHHVAPAQNGSSNRVDTRKHNDQTTHDKLQLGHLVSLELRFSEQDRCVPLPQLCWYAK
jgi:hypothetical protein